ncbi:VOC family protein [Ensifer adhaerens]|uniref:VOC family protein n=1 Tax=Ensifer adhaerens TaxID=106592 RepID=UPI000FDAD611|nr:VOC family protein [Ensifer adhaerens]MDF8357589.1 VOC family protein [Ensifer adhaerens]THA61051.1 VOC family protein [Ensifer adhaerens]
MPIIREIVFESSTPSRLAAFWASVLDDYAVRPYDDAEIARLAALGLTPETDPTVMVDGPGPSLCFQRVPSRDYTNNRIHLDLAVDDVATWVERVASLGARIVRREAGYTVMKDPEGNQFCITSDRRG